MSIMLHITITLSITLRTPHVCNETRFFFFFTKPKFRPYRFDIDIRILAAGRKMKQHEAMAKGMQMPRGNIFKIGIINRWIVFIALQRVIKSQDLGNLINISKIKIISK